MSVKYAYIFHNVSVKDTDTTETCSDAGYSPLEIDLLNLDFAHMKMWSKIKTYFRKRKRLIKKLLAVALML